MTTTKAITTRGCAVTRSEQSGLWVVTRDGAMIACARSKLAAVNAARRRLQLAPIAKQIARSS